MKKPLLFGIILTVCVVIVAIVFVQAYPLGIVSLWKFDEGSGSVAYDSVDTNDGTIYGPTYTTGIVGDALSFDGVDNYVNVGNDASLTSLTPSAMTIEAWVYNTQLISTTGIDLRTIVAQRPYGQDKGYGLQYGYVAGYGVDDYIVTIAFFGGYQGIVKQNISPNQWHHIAGVFDNNIATIYINGEAQTTTNIGSGYTTSNDDVIIGRHGNWASRYDYHKGIIDEVAIYNRALSAEEIAALAGLTCVAPPEDLVSWWPGDGNADDIEGINDGTVYDAIYVPGKVDQAFSFDGDGDYVDCGDDASLDITSELTIDAWINRPNFDTHGTIVGKTNGSSASAGYGLFSYMGGVELAFYSEGGWKRTWPRVSITANEWHHIAGTFDGNNLYLYVDGEQKASRAYSGTIAIAAGHSLHIAYWRLGLPTYFEGLIDEVEIFNRALSAPEIRAIYLAGSAGKCKVEPNQLPDAYAGLDQTVECTGPTGTPVILNGLGSQDPDGDPRTYTWTGLFPEGDGTVNGATPTITLPLGTSTITLVVNDGHGDSEPDEVDITITVGVYGFLPPLDSLVLSLVLEGEDAAPPPRKAFKQGRTLPLKLQLSCGNTVFSGTDVTPPKIVGLAWQNSASDLETIDMDSGEANDSGPYFRFSDPIWVYNLSTRDLRIGTYVISIEMPDGRLFSGTFMLR